MPNLKFYTSWAVSLNQQRPILLGKMLEEPQLKAILDPAGPSLDFIEWCDGDVVACLLTL